MLKLKRISLIALACLLLTSCEFISNSFEYKKTTKLFVEDLLKKDYDKCLSKMAIEHSPANDTEIVTMKKKLANFRELLVRNSGTELDYSFMSAEKKFSTSKDDSTPANATISFIQFSNKKEFGIFRVLFDDQSKKILNIDIVEMKIPIPSMTKFWLFGVLALCVPAFNIYVVRQIKRSGLKKKWLKYIAVICLNTPAITYKAISGLSIAFINFQLLFGIGFGFMGYLNSFWTFGIPLGGIYWLWKLRSINKLTNEYPTETDIQTSLTE